MSRHLRLIVAGVLALASTAPAVAHAAPEGQMTWALHFSLAPTLFEPAETPGVVSPYMILYALHDALVKPMPGQSMAPSLAESWKASPDGLVYEFVLRRGPRFHNGDPVTADDVKFSFERYRGISAKMLRDRVAAIETPEPHGPKPPALRDFMDGARPDVHREVGIMADFANPTRIADFALGLSRPGYMGAWSAYTTDPRFTYRADRLAEARALGERLADVRDTLRPVDPE